MLASEPRLVISVLFSVYVIMIARAWRIYDAELALNTDQREDFKRRLSEPWEHWRVTPDTKYGGLRTPCNGSPCRNLRSRSHSPNISTLIPKNLPVAGNETGANEFGDVVHVVYTRFMQSQPGLVELGSARLEMFRTFCFPTLVRQTNPAFLWIIHTDPALSPAIRDAMIDLIRPFPNFLLVVSNDFPMDFRASNSFSEDTILSGNLSYAIRAQSAAKKRTVLETRLDADDGLHDDFIAIVQEEAKAFLVPTRKTLEWPSRAESVANHAGLEVENTFSDGTERPLWMVWCAYTVLEWHAVPQKLERHASGYLLGVATNYCTTAGLTVGYSANTPFIYVPKAPHHKIHLTVPPCSRSRRSNCLHRMAELQPSAIRARTTTSAGMDGVVMAETKKVSTPTNCTGQDTDRLKDEKELNDQKVIWGHVAEHMHIREENAARARSYLTLHQAAIAADNLRGQCTKGHSCKESTKAVLEELIAHQIELNG